MRFVPALVAILLALAIPSSGASQTGAARYPNSIAVLGHSGATGYDSDPKRPRVDINANSWATGKNLAVNSLYSRILAKNPRIKGHNTNLAQDGGTVRELLNQAHEAVGLTPKPELIVIQIMDNDIVCPAAKRDYAKFKAGVVASLKVLVRGSPSSRMFVVSQFGSPGTYVKTLTRDERLGFAGDGPCDFVNNAGKIVATKVARLDGVIHGYEAQLRTACGQFRQCRYDGGAFGRVVDRRAWISEDLNHFSIRGHAKAAAVAWAAMQRVGIVPR